MTKFRHLLTLAALGTCAFALPFQGNRKAVQIWTAGFGPTSDVRIRNPRFVWQVWADGSAKITDGTMVINGKKVDAKYDSTKRELAFEPPSDLAVGTYEVHAKVKVDNWANFDKNWTVTIRSDAVETTANLTSNSRQAIDEFNRIRVAHGFAPCRFDAALNLAATAHTKYLALNQEGGHAEEPSKPGFTGAEPKDRVNLFGHVGSSWEVVSMGGTSPADGIRGLWDAPYHRIHMMRPGPGIVGASFSDRYFTMDGDTSIEDGDYVSPPSNGQNVPPSWHNQEVPDPMRNYPEAETTLGYPIVMNVYGDGIEDVELISSSLKEAYGDDVPRFELTPHNDEHLQTSVILIPKEPLKAHTTYSVNLKLRDNKGNTHSKAWKFTTL